RRAHRRGQEDRSQEMNADVTTPSETAAAEPAAPRAKNTRTLIGKVVSDKRSKTVTVLIERRTKHELYGKIVAKSSKYHAHDAAGEYKNSDVAENVARARRGGRVQEWRRRRDRREPADLEDQVLGRDAPGPEGRHGLIRREALF